MTNVMLQFVRTAGRMPDKRAAVERREDFLERAAFRAGWEAFVAAEAFTVIRPTKHGTKAIEARPMVTDVAFETDGVVVLRCDWTERYVSPLRLAQSVTPDVPPEVLHVRKLAQGFTSQIGLNASRNSAEA